MSTTRARPDMSAGTSRAALSINSSATHANYNEVETPLGPRWRVDVHTATGGRKEVALVQDRATAFAIWTALTSAIEALSAASEAIQRAKEGGR